MTRQMLRTEVREQKEMSTKKIKSVNLRAKHLTCPVSLVRKIKTSCLLGMSKGANYFAMRKQKAHTANAAFFLTN